MCDSAKLSTANYNSSSNVRGSILCQNARRNQIVNIILLKMGKPKRGKKEQADDEFDDIEKELAALRLESGLKTDEADGSELSVTKKEKKKTRKKKDEQLEEPDDKEAKGEGYGSDENQSEDIVRISKKDKRKNKSKKDFSDDEKEGDSDNEISIKSKKKEKRKKKDVHDSDEDAIIVPVSKKDSKKSKHKFDDGDGDLPAVSKLSAFAMLDVEDDLDVSESEETSEKSPPPEPVVTESKSKKTKEKKGKKQKAKQDEDDIDELLREIESKEPKGKKGKKDKKGNVDEEITEADQVNGEQAIAQENEAQKKKDKKKQAAKDSADDIDSFEHLKEADTVETVDAEAEAGQLEKETKKKKKQKDKHDRREEEDLEVTLDVVDPEAEAELLEQEKKKKKKKGKLVEKEDISKDDQKEAEDEVVADDDTHTVKTAAQKKAEKKEREKKKREAEKIAKKEKKPPTKIVAKDETAHEADVTAEKPIEMQDIEAQPKVAEGEGDDVEEETSEKKKKKKKKGKEEKEKEKKKPGKSQLKAMQEALKKLQEEQEKARLEEEERIRKEEEAEAARLEKLRLEKERKERKKQKEKERKERLRAEGKLLTKSQKQAQARAQAMLEAMKAQGFQIPTKDDDAQQKKRPAYVDKRTRQRQLRKLEAQKSEEKEEEEPKESEAPVVEEVQKEDVVTAEPEPKDDDEEEDVKEAWDISDDEEKDEKKDMKETEEEVHKKTKMEPALEKVKRVSSEEKEEEEEEEEEEESEEEEEDDEEPEDDEDEAEKESEESEEESASESESESDDDRTLAQKIRDRALARIQKRKELAEKSVSTDRLRSPVVCVLGHVDTGKTKILDKIRKTHVQDGEAGGITQQIGATMVPADAVKTQASFVKKFSDLEVKVPGLLIIDTPGHESFSNLRSRGSSLCDIAVLVVDIMHGLEPQTIESINLLKKRKTPFVVALNKIDRLFEWKRVPTSDIRDTLKKQARNTKMEFDERVQETVVQFAEQGLNVALFYENKDPRTYISLVPTSAHSGDGMGNLMALLVELSQTMLAKRLAYSSLLQCSVMEVKALPGLGTTVDVILVNGKLKEGCTVVMGGVEGPIISQVRGLLTPEPLRELRVKNQWQHHKEIEGSQGVKIIGKDLEKVLAGLPLFVAEQEDEIPIWEEETAAHLKHVLGSIKLADKGVYVQSSTLGSLEALLEFLKSSKIPYSGINIGPVHKKDVMKASTMIESEPQFATVLAFDVKIERDAQEMADSLGVRIFSANIIYHLFDAFVAYQDEYKKKKQEEFKNVAVFPCKVRILPQFIFNSRDPIVVGVSVEAGTIRPGIPLCVPSKEFCNIGVVSTIEINHKPVDSAKKGQEVCLKIEHVGGDAPKMFGRHFDHTDIVVSKITRESIDVCKKYFRDELQKADWQLMIELKKIFDIL